MLLVSQRIESPSDVWATSWTKQLIKWNFGNLLKLKNLCSFFIFYKVAKALDMRLNIFLLIHLTSIYQMSIIKNTADIMEIYTRAHSLIKGHSISTNNSDTR